MNKEFKEWFNERYPSAGVEIDKAREEATLRAWEASRNSLLKKLSKVLKSKRCAEDNCRHCKSWPCVNSLLLNIKKDFSKLIYDK